MRGDEQGSGWEEWMTWQRSMDVVMLFGLRERWEGGRRLLMTDCCV